MAALASDFTFLCHGYGGWAANDNHARGNVTREARVIAGRAYVTGIAYDDVGKTRTVTNPLGKQAIYRLESFQDQLRIKQIAGQPSANCVGADSNIAYDANGYVAQQTDGNGNVIKYTRNAKGQETSRTEAFGTPQARTITTVWHTVFHLPARSVAPGLSTDFAYDAFGSLTSRVETDTTAQASAGQTRSWGFSYLPNGLLDVADGPLAGAGDSVNYDYDAKGFLAQVTNEAGHVTRRKKGSEKRGQTPFSPPYVDPFFATFVEFMRPIYKKYPKIAEMAGFDAED